MSEGAAEEQFDLCIVGAGSAGLSLAAGAAQLGLKTALIERAQMGGDCLNFGCVPSKALLAAASKRMALQDAAAFGLAETAPPAVDFPAVMRHVQGVIAAIAPMDSQARFEGLGVHVIRGSAAFVSAEAVAVGARRIAAKRFVVATGSKPFVPPIQGLAKVPYLTNETIFNLAEQPAHLLVLGGGPIGCELAQAFRRLGSKVTVIERETILPREDPELAETLRSRLVQEGLVLKERKTAASVSGEAGRIAVTLADAETPDAPEETVEGSHLLVAVGRRPDYSGLDLEKTQIIFENGRPFVDQRLRSSNRRIFFAGDAAGGQQFTHLAGAHASVLIKNLLFKIPARADKLVVPRVTYTDPEVASVGLDEAAARAQGEAFNVLRWSLHENDRAQAEHATHGHIKVLVSPKGKVLGAAIAAAHAGELILPWVLAIEKKLPISALASTVAPYPTLSEISKRAAGSFYVNKLFSEKTRRIVRFLQKLG